MELPSLTYYFWDTTLVKRVFIYCATARHAARVSFLCWCSLLSSPAYSDTHYVSLAGGNTSPYTNWATAAHAIQDCVDDGAVLPGDVVVVSNGWYETGSRTNSYCGNVTNRVVVDK